MYFGMLNPTELVVILVIVLVIFGPKKLPEIGRSVGEMLANFRRSTRNDETESGDGSVISSSEAKETDNKVQR